MNKAGSNPMRWVLLLLVAAVVVPTVCLVWFMDQAVRNERLAVRQKLIDVCNEKAERFAGDFSDLWREEMEALERHDTLPEKENVHLWIDAIRGRADSAVIFDEAGGVVFPYLQEDETGDFSADLQEVMEQEYAGEYETALAAYDEIIEETGDRDELFGAYMGKLRCLERLRSKVGDVPVADLHHELLWGNEREIRAKFTPTQVAMIRVLQVDWRDRVYGTYSSGTMFIGLDMWYTRFEKYPAETTIWALEKLIGIAEKYEGEYPNVGEAIVKAKAVLHKERVSLEAAKRLVEGDLYGQAEIGELLRLDGEQGLYAVRQGNVFAIWTAETLRGMIAQAADALAMEGMDARVLDGYGNVLYGQEVTDEGAFLVKGIYSAIEGARVSYTFADDNVFEAAAKRQSAIYLWTGVLVIGTILVCGAVATGAINRQMRLSRLKNDFIATVTHELKTPLASMRLLVDTLVEGRYENQEKVGEYLGLISKENERLSRLIDHFLTFSRMERNKQAFELVPLAPGEIAEAAAGALQAKYENEKCRIETRIGEDLPEIYADRDAMTTVVVNLLDNACKYSFEQKCVTLSVSAEGGSMCFAVKDKGIGMSRREVRRIFERFYQADNRLSRQAEGTGLGLSIVKFIVDAHKGRIEVDSEPGKGSEFRVYLTAEGA